MVVGVAETICASTVLPPPKSEITFGAEKLLQLMVRISLPCGRPAVDEMLEMTGAVLGGGVTTGLRLNVTVVVLATLATGAVTVGVPAVDGVGVAVAVAVAAALVVVGIVVGAFAPVNEPRLVVNSTAVPFRTALPFCVTLAVITDV